ncbi:uncharacterized protein LOC142635638 [Castanea sativa]|uniref:uncharacterized protein LOC142635638 n=1 Tax=Castanea sativa TaxID=21020 RepID=UPI003F6535BD
MIEELKKCKETKKRIQSEIGNPYGDPFDVDEEEEEEDEVRVVEKSPPQTLGKRKSRGKDVDIDMSQIREKKKIKSYFASRTTPGAQPSIRSALATKAMVDNAKMNVARWWYHSNVPFYASQSPYYQLMIDSIASIGPGFKGPSFYELRGPLLRNAVHEVNDFLLDIKNDWKVYGCSVMSMGGQIKNAHCIDLMLENIANPKWFPLVDEAIKKAKKITKFIYNHGVVLDLMRQDFTNGRELCRPAITRFATNFLSLQSMLRFKKELRQMFTSDKWLSCPHAKTAVGKEISKIVLEDYSFWSQCTHIVKVSEPLVRVLRLVDGDEKPAMGYLYEAMDKAKEEIKRRLKNKFHGGSNLALELPIYNHLPFVCLVNVVVQPVVREIGAHLNMFTQRREIDWNISENIQRNKYALDPISLDNIDLMGDWVAEEPALLNPDDVNWDCLNEPSGHRECGRGC